MPPALLRLGVVAVLATAMALPAVAHVRAAETHAVEIADFAFSPATLTITAGDTVTWTNTDAVAHTATSTTGAFDSGELAQGASYSVTFTTPGTYDYLCTPHPTMTGRIVVQAAAAPTPVPSSGELPDVAVPVPADDPLVGVGLGLLGLAAAIGLRRLARRAS